MVKVLAACLGQMLAFPTDRSSLSSANSKKEEKKALKRLRRNNCDFSGVLSGCCFSAFVASERAWQASAHFRDTSSSSGKRFITHLNDRRNVIFSSQPWKYSKRDLSNAFLAVDLL